MNVVDVDKTNFDSVVIEGSKSVPVLVDFWAPWCAPCRALGPVLEKLADEYAGRFTLAKINSDEDAELSARYNVRGIPNVKAFVGGAVVDEFSGALPESGVRRFLAGVVSSPVEELREEAADLYGRTRDLDQSLAILTKAEELDPADEGVRIDRAALLVDAERYDDARAVIAGLKPLTQMDERVGALNPKLELAQGAAEAPSEQALEERIAKDPNDLEARLQLAHHHVGQKSFREALEQLLAIVERDRGYRDDVGRRTVLKVFELLGNQGELVSAFRKRLARTMN